MRSVCFCCDVGYAVCSFFVTEGVDSEIVSSQGSLRLSSASSIVLDSSSLVCVSESPVFTFSTSGPVSSGLVQSLAFDVSGGDVQFSSVRNVSFHRGSSSVSPFGVVFDVLDGDLSFRSGSGVARFVSFSHICV